MEVRIGKHNSNDIVVNDRLSDEFHCVIYFADGQMRLRDQNSRFGTLVNGHKERDILLRQGDVIQIGFAKIDWEARCFIAEYSVYEGFTSETQTELELEKPNVIQPEISISAIQQPTESPVVIPEKYLRDARGALIREWNKRLLESELDYEARPLPDSENLSAEPSFSDAADSSTTTISHLSAKDQFSDSSVKSDFLPSKTSNKAFILSPYVLMLLIVLGMAGLGWLVAFVSH